MSSSDVRPHLFYSPDSDASAPLTDETIASVQARLGVTFPPAYLRVMRHRNGGALRFDAYQRQGDSPVDCTQLYAIGPELIDYATLFADVLQNGMIPIGDSTGGHGIIGLDYRRCGSAGEPSVVWVGWGEDQHGQIEPVAPDFRTFVNGLVRSELSHCYGVRGDLPDIRRRLQAHVRARTPIWALIGQVVACLCRSPLPSDSITLVRPGWRGDVMRTAWIDVYPNREVPGETVIDFPEHPTVQWVLACSIAPEVRPQAEVALRRAFPDMVVLHVPIWSVPAPT